MKQRRQTGGASFEAKLFRYPGAGGWTFAPVPDSHAPPVTHGWGRTPVMATVDGVRWRTSVWRDRTHGTLLAVPKHARGAKGDGDVVEVQIEPPPDDPPPAPPPARGTRPRKRG